MGTTEPEFNHIYDEFYEKISHYLKRLIGENEAEDLTQEVFLKINKGLAGFEGKSSISTWVYRIATNAALDKVKSRSHREDSKTVVLEEASNDTENVCAEKTSLSAEREAIRNEMNECIQEFVDRLPTDYRTVIILSEIKDLKNQEVADILRLSLDAVKIRLHRARARLKTEFEAGCNFYHDEDGKLACDRKKKMKKPE
jgi:RNA polymerase sigma-70 factor (ECF subfamily)